MFAIRCAASKSRSARLALGLRPAPLSDILGGAQVAAGPRGVGAADDVHDALVAGLGRDPPVAVDIAALPLLALKLGPEPLGFLRARCRSP